MAYGPYSYSVSVDDDDYIDVYKDGEQRKTTMAVIKDYIESAGFTNVGDLSAANLSATSDVTAGGNVVTDAIISATADTDITITPDGTGVVDFGTVIQLPAATVATLPATPAVGMIGRVTDADTPAVGSTVAGSGAAAALVWYNGTNWTVIGI